MVIEPETRPSWRRTMPETRSLRAVLLGGAIILAGCSDAGNVLTEPASRNGGAIDPAAHTDQGTLKTRHDVQIVSATGDIAPAVAEFRALLGELSLNLPGEQAGERRE